MLSKHQLYTKIGLDNIYRRCHLPLKTTAPIALANAAGAQQARVNPQLRHTEAQ
jgi:hypothetical protein